MWEHLPVGISDDQRLSDQSGPSARIEKRASWPLWWMGGSVRTSQIAFVGILLFTAAASADIPGLQRAVNAARTRANQAQSALNVAAAADNTAGKNLAQALKDCLGWNLPVSPVPPQQKASCQARLTNAQNTKQTADARLAQAQHAAMQTKIDLLNAQIALDQGVVDLDQTADKTATDHLNSV